MLHLHGGSILLDRLRTAGLPGRFLEWGEVRCAGPSPDLPPDRYRAWRAAFLDAAPGPRPHSPILPLLEIQDRALEKATATEDEIVLWFGPELFCQAILIAALDRLGEASARLSLVCLDRYPGVDDHRSCTVSFLNEAQLRDVFATRPPVTAEQRAYGRAAWKAWCAPTPEPLDQMRRRSPAPLSFLPAALLRHLEELPGAGDGLTRCERAVLNALATGPLTFSRLFPGIQEDEERRWLTDTLLFDLLHRLMAPRVPLVSVAGPPPWEGGGLDVARYSLTPAGEEVLRGTRDAIETNGVDRWWGGVHLTPEHDWRWDAAREQPVRVS